MENSLETGITVAQQTVASPVQMPASPGLRMRPRERRKTPAFLSNLGKPTLRGIRKCPQCGIYNGTRGLSCKNKACGAVFRDGGTAVGKSGLKKGAAEAVRLVIDGGGGGGSGGEGESAGSTGVTQVFSVCQRSRGVEQRGFVELTLTDTAIATTDGTVLTHVSFGRCFMPACRQVQGHGQTPSLEQVSSDGQPSGESSTQQQPESPCVHVKRAMECQDQATPLSLKSSVLESLQAPGQVKEELWRLATESPGPLVQRVSRGTMVVKCHANEHHPLGLLHLTIGPVTGASRREARTVEGLCPQFFCACHTTHAKKSTEVQTAGGTLQDGEGQSEAGQPSTLLPDEPPLLPAAPSSSSSSVPELCLHFYACVCTLSSDEKLAVEFGDFLSRGSANGYSVGAHVGANGSILGARSRQQTTDPGVPNRAKRLRVDETLAANVPNQAMRENPLHPPLRKPSQRKQPLSAVLKNPGGGQSVDESHVSLTFQQWLTGVTERIHQTMHFQFDGKPEPLVFHIPQAFFNALQQRLSLGSKKRRLPNSTTAFVRNDALPLGTFSKYTWHITNLLQVKQIFDTPELPLELTQSFVKNRDGSFSPFRCPDVSPEPLPEGHGRTERPQPIRPLELRTFLRVGTPTPEDKSLTPFVIEWIPDILPRSRVGELRIRFEYGHQHGVQLDPSDSGATRTGGAPEGSSGAGVQAAPDVSQSLPAPTIEIVRVTVP